MDGCEAGLHREKGRDDEIRLSIHDQAALLPVDLSRSVLERAFDEFRNSVTS